MDGPATRMGRQRFAARAAQAQRFEYLAPQHVLPGGASQLLDESAQERVADVGIVEAATYGMPVRLFAQNIGELWTQRAGCALPPGRGSLCRQPSPVREQFGDRGLPRA